MSPPVVVYSDLLETLLHWRTRLYLNILQYCRVQAHQGAATWSHEDGAEVASVGFSELPIVGLDAITLTHREWDILSTPVHLLWLAG